MAEPIYPPTYPGEPAAWKPAPGESYAMLNGHPVPLDDSPAALIARLTSGDVGDEWGHQRVDFYVARCRVTGRRYEVVSAATESDQLEVTRITAPTYAEARRKVGEYLAAGS